MATPRREPLAREEPAQLQVAATNGSIVTDSRRRKYIDFVMGWCVGNFGWRPAVIAKAIERFKGPDYVYPGYSYGADAPARRQGFLCCRSSRLPRRCRARGLVKCGDRYEDEGSVVDSAASAR